MYKSKFIEVTLHPENSMLEATWFPTSEEMTEEEFKDEMLGFRELFLQHKPKKELVNTKDFLFTIHPEIQKWTDENIHKLQNEQGCLKKVAFIVSEDVIAALSVEQIFDEENSAAFNVRYFSERQEAEEWLNL
ncbi:STAS/SEC14 domain-containing protein [Bernardetia sp.]|uniref:STAS/SEC14 domain-containing protein n=1 Tax=Bernardetia sp. TaxID=1937974 RepID=UPI0025C39B68|nr:STAS/SEC14 domain-containing protein [Bernardetia sp.]